MQPSQMNQRAFGRQMGDAVVLWVRPSRVAGHTGTKWPVSKARLAKLERVMPKAFVNVLRPAIKKREPFVIPAEHFGAPTPMADTALRIKIADFIHRKGPLEDTAWFQELATELDRDGIAHHKAIALQSRDHIHGFFQSYVIPMIESLRRDGFKPDETGFESTAVIDAEGRLSKSGSGNHRFAICQVLDVPQFPLRVVAVHAEWYARKVRPEGDTWPALNDALGKVEAEHQ